VVDVRITDEPDEAAIAELRERVIAFNLAATGYGPGRSLGCYLRDEGGLYAGLDGFTWGGYAMIEWLWVAAVRRGEGIGRAMVAAAEAEAARRGCRVVRVNTHTFQAPDFYARLGYEQVGRAADAPVGHGEVFLVKRLA
jgi:GNAT superfamily N-acetyltransferase